MIRALVLCLLLAGCLSPLGLLGKGPNVAANGQIGATNAQTIGTTDTSSQSVSRSTVGTVRQSRDVQAVAAEQVGQITVNQGQGWKREYACWALIIAALFLDSPRRWPGEIAAAFRGRRG